MDVDLGVEAWMKMTTLIMNFVLNIYVSEVNVVNMVERADYFVNVKTNIYVHVQMEMKQAFF